MPLIVAPIHKRLKSPRLMMATELITAAAILFAVMPAALAVYVYLL